MIIVRLNGGLGNQLFQYAAARRLAHVNHTELKIDISVFESYKLHAYSLGHFNIKEEFASQEEIKAFHGGAFANTVFHALGKLTPHQKPQRATERYFHFDADILKLPKDVYLDGYWQSERYFRDIGDLLRQELTLKSAPGGLTLAVSEKIRALPSVSVHVRRRDYVTDPNTRQIHGLCSLDYYHAAMAQLTREVEGLQFFVFSDDPQWARDNLKLEREATFVAHNGPDKNYEDLWLMSLCHHHIIANSTFSWWGAWLSTNPCKRVIAPRRWFQTDDRNTKDMLPNTWQRI